MEDANRNHDSRVPEHYPTIREALARSLLAYGRSLNSTARLVGSCLVSGILFVALWACLNGISTLFLGSRGSDTVIQVILLLCAPPIVRAGLIATALQGGNKKQRHSR